MRKVRYLLAAALLTMGAASAATIYKAQGVAVGGAGYAFDQKSSGTAIADTGYVFDNPALGAYARGTGLASQYGVGAGAELSVFWFGSAANSEGLGRAETDVVFSGPVTGDLIPVSVNLFVDGGFGGGYNADQSSLREITLSIALYSGNAYGRVGERVTGGVPVAILEGPLAPSGTACLGAGCLIESPVFYVPANTPVSFWMQLLARVEAGYGVASASFENTLYFPLDQDVFNLPDGYTADMAGLSVMNNRVVIPNGGGGEGEIPEPGTYALVGIGLTVVVVMAGRRWRVSGDR